MKTEEQKIVDAFDPNIKALLSPLLMYTTIIHVNLDVNREYMALICTETITVSKGNAEDIQKLIFYDKFIEMFPVFGRTVIKFKK